jgi:PDDEXK-like uncharacterized protein DUF3799
MVTAFLAPGIHDLDAAAYHADPSEQPSLSASIATVLCTESPAHARAKHPRLNPLYVRHEEQRFDPGSAAHALFLEGRDAVEVVEAKDWRTNLAKAARDAARLDGRIPLLAHQWDEVQTMLAATRAQLERVAVDPPLFVNGKPERTLIWEEDGVYCRALLDWLHDDHGTIDDLKTTSASANPEKWSRTMFGMGADIQAAFYLRAVKALTGRDAEFRWCVQETYPPYALTVFTLAPDALALAEAKVDYAIRTWRRCLETDDWRAYPAKVCHIELPAWEEPRWMERELREVA